ncbi:MAG TPA: SusC/RagA family TonB-linked outer membrane protein [Bacteroidales bacterium]|nr:SusC/RagA family TonB-linked outer membrane protein [Bacteroidales bacterium]HOQ57690.1 SusC/RagA family TonB-linked outer membrane protein [Bacteroidales bacterium]
MKKIITLLILCLLLIGTSSAQKTLTGRVYENFGGKEELAVGVNISFNNAQNRMVEGTVSNSNGEYSLRVPLGGGPYTVVFSYIGMKTQSIPYNGQSSLNVVLEEDAKALDEVVVAAKQEQKNEMGITLREQTAATERILLSEIIEFTPVTSVEEALQGRLAGVDILTGGDPGARNSIRIRGTATLNTSADPLIVINGVPYSTDIDDSFNFATASNEDYAAMLNLSPYDIESIEVLKDAASTAIYGTSGASGVLLITTKTGSKGKPRFTLSSKFTAKFEPESIPMLNGKEYVAFIEDAIWNTANAKGVSTSAALLELLYDTPEINFNKEWRYFNEYNTNTDWLAAVVQDAYTTDNNFSMSGGGEKATYRFSLSYADEDGTTIGTNMNRFSSTLNIGYRFNDKLRVETDFSYAETDKKANWTDNVRSEAMLKMPNKSPYWIDDITLTPTDRYFNRQNAEEFQGAFTGSKNFHPIAMANESFNNSLQQEEKMNFRLNYDILPGLIYTGYVSMKFKTIKNRAFLPQSATGVTMDNTYANRSSDAYSDNLALQTENKLIFRRNWNGIHNIVATALWRTSDSQSSNYSNTIYGVASKHASDPSTNGAIVERGSGDSQVRSISGIGGINYTFLNRYILSGTVNYEGKSSLGKANRWGLFPSLGLAWHIKEENFLQNADWLSSMKLRCSYGQSGAAPSGTAPYMGTYSALGDGYRDNPSIVPVSVQLNKLKWQTASEYDAGFDAGFLDQRLTATFDIYYKYITDLLQRRIAIPTTSGYNSQGNSIAYYNSGEMSNTGWEFRIDYTVVQNDDWRITLNYNIARNINRIEKLPENLPESSYSLRNGTYAQRIIVGAPVGSFFGYRYLGVYDTTLETYARDARGAVMTDLDGKPIVMKNGTYTCFPGDAKYQDINHDGVINQSDIVYIGNANPVVTGGGGFTAKYKQLTLTTFLHYRLGQKIVNQARMNSEAMYGTDNQSLSVLRRWRSPGDDTDIPRALWQYGYNYLGSDRFVEDCSFLRLKTISLSYGLPKNFCRKIKVNTINAFVTAYDLLTWTNYTGQDPEVTLPSRVTDIAMDRAQTPPGKRISGGLIINF